MIVSVLLFRRNVKLRCEESAAADAYRLHRIVVERQKRFLVVRSSNDISQRCDSLTMELYNSEYNSLRLLLGLRE